jgi:hypothetical protein
MAPDNVPDVCPACGDPLCHGECPAADGAWVVGAAVCGVALTEIRWLGAITPIGGVLFLVGWAALAWQSGAVKP